ncbi:MAG: mechanosensitive ion channel domain-containing protein, partial [Planctomycetota bacterium]
GFSSSKTAIAQFVLPPGMSDELAVDQNGTTNDQEKEADSLPTTKQVFQEWTSSIAQAELSDDIKAKLEEEISLAEKQANEIPSLNASTTKNRQLLDATDERLTSARSQLEELSKVEPSSPSLDDSSLVELEPKLAALETKVEAAKAALTEIESQLVQSSQRNTQIEMELPTLLNRQKENTDALETLIAAKDGSLTTDVAILAQQVKARWLEAKTAALQAEKGRLDAEAAAGLTQIERDVRARELELAQQELTQLNSDVEALRKMEAGSRAKKASNEAENKELIPEELRSIAEKNKQLANRTVEVIDAAEESGRLLAELKEQKETLQESFNKAKERLKSVGLTDAVGAMLRNLSQSLPSPGAYQFRIRSRTALINEANYELLENRDLRARDLSETIEELTAASRTYMTNDQFEALEEQARELIQKQNTEYLSPLIQAQDRYFQTLVSISTVEQETIDLVGEAQQYINENVLWTRSAKPLWQAPVPSVQDIVLLSDANRGSVISTLATDIRRRWIGYVLAAICFTVLISLRYRLRQQIESLSKIAESRTCIRFRPTVRALILTVVISVALPLMAWMIGSRLATIQSGDIGSAAVVEALKTFAFLFFPLEFMRQVCRHRGLAESHLEWPPNSIAKVRRNLRMCLYGVVPLLTIASLAQTDGGIVENDSLQRLLCIAAMGLLSLFFFRTFHPYRGAFAAFLASRSNGWLWRTRFVWFPTLVAIPQILAILSFIGYHFTAEQLGWRFFESIGLMFFLGILMSLVLRWTRLHQRELRMESLRQQRAQQAALAQLQKASGSDSEIAHSLPSSANGKASDPPEPSLRQALSNSSSLAAIDARQELEAEELSGQMEDSRRLFRAIMFVLALSGLYFVWSDVTPALGAFEKWTFGYSSYIEKVVVSENGETRTEVRTVVDPITIADVALGLIIVGLTIAAVYNLPGLLEFAVLSRLPLDRSMRYAITTLVSYAIVLAGIIFSARLIGLHWDQVQWMATALTFGLAFGMQEMFANFIAGIIILFERPVRVGDVVEIDGVTGFVTKVRIRATTITNFDRKDYIVPNKEFITGKVLNWTRSDDVQRLTIFVGVAYGSDTRLTRKLLMEAAAEHPDVLDEPPVLVSFEEFGDNTLNFKLRVFMQSFDLRLKVLNDLHHAIDDKFRAADIEIAFPQQDLHLRSLPKEVLGFFSRHHEASVQKA